MSNDGSESSRSARHPLVSVCIPAYNAERTIGAALSSVLKQTYSRMEVLVVDNASEDRTVAVVIEFDDPRIRLHQNRTNLGGEGNFTRCVQLATGDYIAVFHADDIYLPDIVSRQIQAFQLIMRKG